MANIKSRYSKPHHSDKALLVVLYQRALIYPRCKKYAILSGHRVSLLLRFVSSHISYVMLPISERCLYAPVRQPRQGFHWICYVFLRNAAFCFSAALLSSRNLCIVYSAILPCNKVVPASLSLGLSYQALHTFGESFYLHPTLLKQRNGCI